MTPSPPRGLPSLPPPGSGSPYDDDKRNNLRFFMDGLFVRPLASASVD
jgi:hypothetical protein